jgi:hypothetical protein
VQGRITVMVNGVRFSLVPGSAVRDLSPLQPSETRRALDLGLAHYEDSQGNEVGSGGGLWDGQDLRIVWTKEAATDRLMGPP